MRLMVHLLRNLIDNDADRQICWLPASRHAQSPPSRTSTL
jgi:hypothetical protein